MCVYLVDCSQINAPLGNFSLNLQSIDLSSRSCFNDDRCINKNWAHSSWALYTFVHPRVFEFKFQPLILRLLVVSFSAPA